MHSASVSILCQQLKAQVWTAGCFLTAQALCCGGEMLVSTSRSRSTQLSRHSSSIQSYHLYFSSMISVWPFSRLEEESLRKVSRKMQNVKVCTHLAGYFLGFFFDAGTSAFLGGFSTKLAFRLWPVRISGKS